ncbi:MAG: hypothetical protein H6Q72_967 [Firmicutes bacterium]|nr:hypothetical protein [Bacillota bacterium]
MFEKIYYIISIPLGIIMAFGIIGAFINGFSDLARQLRCNRSGAQSSTETFMMIAFFVVIMIVLMCLGLRPKGSHGIMID